MKPVLRKQHVPEKSFAQWNKTIAAALGAVGKPDFPIHIERAMGTIVDFDLIVFFAYPGTGKPICLHHNFDEKKAATAVYAYMQGPYLLDPFYEIAVNSNVTGMQPLRHIAPDKFYSTNYYKQHYALTDIRDEVGIVCRPANGSCLIISVTRKHGSPKFGQRDLASIRAVEPVIRMLTENHQNALSKTAMIDAHADFVDSIHTVVDLAASGSLTPREIEVTSLILRGHSTSSIAANLKIAEGTAKIHRKNIYKKLRISSQAELFAKFISRL